MKTVCLDITSIFTALSGYRKTRRLLSRGMTVFFVCNVSTVCGVRGIMMHEDIVQD